MGTPTCIIGVLIINDITEMINEKRTQVIEKF
jgi:hypothetical protein